MRAVRSHFGVGVFEQVVEVGSDQFISDIDSSKGGDGAGPSPHEVSVYWKLPTSALFIRPLQGRLKLIQPYFEPDWLVVFSLELYKASPL